MMHLLAQDYNKIRKPAMKLARFLLTKRDLDAVQHTTPDREVSNSNSAILLLFSRRLLRAKNRRDIIVAILFVNIRNNNFAVH